MIKYGPQGYGAVKLVITTHFHNHALFQSEADKTWGDHLVVTRWNINLNLNALLPLIIVTVVPTMFY